jgi:ketosteroid isomerase-like protein
VAESDPRSVATAFNDRINAGDLDGLAALMTDDHTFIDAAGAEFAPKSVCVAAWRGFFDAFPGYTNVFTVLEAEGDTVAITGYSECSDPQLAGPARWIATVRDDKIARWQVRDA